MRVRFGPLLYFWMLLAIGGLVYFSWSLQQRSAQASALEIARIKGRAQLQLIQSLREWSSSRDIYVRYPAQGLEKPEDSSRDHLAQITTAHLTRELGDILSRHDDRLIFSSLKPLNPDNAPDPWTRSALLAFEDGESEVVERVGHHYRYLAPLFVERSCLQCHGDQGYRIGDVRGGLGFVFPETQIHQLIEDMNQVARRNHTVAFVILALTGLVIVLMLHTFADRLRFSRRENRVLKQQVKTDPLTGVMSRAAIMQQLQYEYQRAGRSHAPLTVMMVDLDHFKWINDNYGHLVGDEVLQGVTARIASRLRTTDFLGRYGGEEFIAILPDTKLVDARTVSERILNRVNAMPYNSSHHQPIAMSVSIGICEMTQSQAATPEELIKFADRAMYQAKHQGRDRVESYPLESPL